MTVYKAIKPQAEKAAEWAVELAQGREADRREHDREQRQGRRADAQARRSSPVTADNVKDTVVKDGFWKADRDLHRRVRGGLREVRHPVGASADERPTSTAAAGRGRERPLLELKGVTSASAPCRR